MNHPHHSQQQPQPQQPQQQLYHHSPHQHPYSQASGSSLSSSSSSWGRPPATTNTGDSSRPSSTTGSSPGATDNKYVCPNCGKAFGRDDLLRRHLAREARALAQPQFDRQKSCYECARSKARCDLEVPSCGRCRSRGKQCVYGARSGNPNVRRQRDSMAPPSNLAAMSMSGSQSGHSGPSTSSYTAQWSSNPDTAYQSDSSHGSLPHTPGSRHSGDDDSSDNGMAWSDSGHGHGYPSGPQSYGSSSTASGSLPATHSGDFAIDLHDTMDQSNMVTPTTYLARHGIHGLMLPPPPPPAPLQGPSAARLMTDIDRGRPSFKTEDGEETPIGRMVSAFAAGPSSMATGDARGRNMISQGPSGLSGSWNHAGATHPGASSSGTGPSAGYQAPSGAMLPSSSMGPPIQPVVGQRTDSLGMRNAQRPQMHKLLTGANMPQPQANQSTNYLGSGKPLFSAMVDFTGWLEEPVVPSPLYPTGPSLAPFAGSLPLPFDAASGNMAPPSQPQNQQPVQHQPSQSMSTMQPDQQAQQQMPASRYWWANPPSQSDFTLMQGVAQATASHLSHYPHLMVLPDPSSPVPPTVHRPWIATIRGNIPGPLAVARVVLAGYAVRLPASESIVWESVARETRRLVSAHESLCADTSPDLDVFGATQALFFYCILLMMCNDPGAVGHVDVSLTNSAFFGLSQLAKTLSIRVRNAQVQRGGRANSAANTGSGTPGKGSPDWLQWGSEETMRRTVWAAYAMLVLQRYRDSADMSEGRLAGVDLILDLELPAVALEFEAGSQEDWAKARAALYPNGPSSLTFRDLLRFRPNGNNNGTPDELGNTVQGSRNSNTSAAGPPPQELFDYFERHDAFVATVLSIAFCLDTGLSV